MSPGEPHGLGILDGTPMVALAGNPSAPPVSFAVFVHPVAPALAGMPDPAAGWTPTQTAAPSRARADRVHSPGPVPEEHDRLRTRLRAPAQLLGRADAVMRVELGADNLGTGSTIPALRL